MKSIVRRSSGKPGLPRRFDRPRRRLGVLLASAMLLSVATFASAAPVQAATGDVTITSLSARSGAAFSWITITGSNFVPLTGVYFGVQLYAGGGESFPGIGATQVRYISSTTLQAEVPEGLFPGAGYIKVTRSPLAQPGEYAYIAFEGLEEPICQFNVQEYSLIGDWFDTEPTAVDDTFDRDESNSGSADWAAPTADYAFLDAHGQVLGNDTVFANFHGYLPLEDRRANLFTGAAHGTVTVNHDGTFDYVPDTFYGQPYTGGDSFTYVAYGSTGDSFTRCSQPATVTIVPSHQLRPVADGYSVVQDRTLTDSTLIGLLFNDINVSLSTGTVLAPTTLATLPTYAIDPYYIDSEPTDQYDDLSFGGIFAGNAFHLVWNGNATGTIVYSTDMRHDITAALAGLPGNLAGNIEVRQLSNSVYRVTFVRGLRDSSQPAISIVKESSDADFPGPVGVTTGTEHLWLTRNGFITSFLGGGQFVYTPDDGFLGVDGFPYQAKNTNVSGRVFPAVHATIEVVAPTVVKGVDDEFTMSEDGTLTFSPGQLLGNDPNATMVSCVGQALITCHPTTLRTGFGTLSLTWADYLGSGFQYLTGGVYTPDANANGTDSFTYSDGYLGDDGQPHNAYGHDGSVVIHVQPVADTPTAAAIDEFTQADTPITIDVAARATDPDGDIDPASMIHDPLPCEDQLTSPPTCTAGTWGSKLHGTWHANGDGTVTYTPTAGFVGTATWPYLISDLTDRTDFSTVSVEVGAAADDSYTTPENTPLVRDAATGILANDNAATASLATGPQHGQVQLAADGSFTYTPDDLFKGNDRFSYSAGGDTAWVGIQVTPVDQAPSVYLNTWCDPSDTGRVCTASDDARDVTEGGTVELNGSLSDPEFDGGTLSITWGDGATTTVAYPCASDPSCPFGTTASYTPPCHDTYCATPLYFHFTHRYDDNPAGGDHESIAVTATEDGGPHGSSETGARVVNAAPQVTVESDCPLCVNPLGSDLSKTTGQPVRLSAQVTDAGTDSGTISIDWGDGSAPTSIAIGCSDPLDLCATASQQALGCGLVNFNLSCGYLAADHTYATAGSYTISVTATDDDGDHSTATTSASITDGSVAPSVTTNPSNQQVTPGATATFTAAASGSPTPTVQWQVQPAGGGSYQDIPGGTSTTLSFTASLSESGNHYRAVFTNAGGTATTTAATLTVSIPPTITSANGTTLTIGSAGTFTITTTGVPTPTLSETGALPSGITFTDNLDGTATIGGTPAAGTAGSYPLTITAANGAAPNATQAFTITVDSSGQTITFAALAGKTYGAAPFTVSATASSGLTVSFTASPAGVCTSGGTDGATITITGVGTCTVTAHQPGDDSWVAADDVARAFAVGQKAVTVSVTPASVQYSDPLPNLDVVGSVPGLVGSDTLSGTLSGCTASGLSVSGGTVQSPAGSYPLTGCTGLSNPNYSVAYAGSLSVTKESATADYSGPTYASTGSSTATKATVTLSGQLTQAADGHAGDLTKASAQFLLYASGNLTMTTPDLTVNGTVNASGAVTGTASNLPVDTYTVVLRINPANTYFTGPEADADLLTVFTPATGTWLSGGGWVIDPSYQNIPVAVSSTRPKGHFGFNVAYAKNNSTAPKGHVAYSFRGADGYMYVMKSSSWQGGAMGLTGTHGAYAAGKCVVVAIDPVTGLPVPGIGGGNFSFRLDVVDGGTGGTNDMFALSIFTPSGALYHRAGTATTPLLLQKGDVSIHAK